MDIDLYIVSGFLGSGKTTFIEQFLGVFKKERLALVVNEFGSIDVDGALLEKRANMVRKIGNGSILCTCRSDQFIDTLRELASKNVRTVIIETSGMTDLDALDPILSTVNKVSKRRYALRTVITIADAPRIQKTIHTLRAVRSQIHKANVVLLNKVDLAENEIMLQNCEKAILEINPQCRIIRTKFCKVDDPSFLLSIKPLQRKKGQEYTIPNEPWLDKMTVRFEHEVDEKKLSIALDEIGPHIIRIKGRVVTKSGTFAIDGIQNDVRIRPAKLVDEGFLNIIYDRDSVMSETIQQKIKSLDENTTIS